MNETNNFYSKYNNKYLELAIEYIISQNKMKNQIIPEIVILFILSFPVLIKLFTNGNIYGKCATDRSRLPGTGTLEGFLHLCQGLTFGICIRLSTIHPAFLILSYIFSIIGVEMFNLMSNQLDDIIINTNLIYYFLKLYTTLTIISLFYTFKKPEDC